MAEPTEFERLMARLAERDDDAARQVVASLYDRVAGVVRPRIGDRYRSKVSPESVANTAFKTFFLRHAAAPYPVRDEEELMRLLARIALAKCFNRIRAFRTQKQDAGREVAGEPFDLAARGPGPEFDVEVRDLLEAHTRELSDAERTVIHLSLAGTPIDEIAAAVGMTTRTVYRIRERFAKRLAGEDPEPG